MDETIITKAATKQAKSKSLGKKNKLNCDNKTLITTDSESEDIDVSNCNDSCEIDVDDKTLNTTNADESIDDETVNDSYVYDDDESKINISNSYDYNDSFDNEMDNDDDEDDDDDNESELVINEDDDASSNTNNTTKATNPVVSAKLKRKNLKISRLSFTDTNTPVDNNNNNINKNRRTRHLSFTNTKLGNSIGNHQSNSVTSIISNNINNNNNGTHRKTLAVQSSTSPINTKCKLFFLFTLL